MYQVLYVDDEEPLLDIAKIFLERTKEFSFTTRTSARDVLDSVDLSAFDAIVADYQMPDMDGIAFLKEVRSRYGDVPFILFTGKGREEVVIEAINNGADFYLQKGGDPKAQFAELKHKLRIAIEGRATGRELEDSRERLSEIIGFLPDATMAIDSGKRVIIWNRAIEEMTGIPASEMIGSSDRAYSVPFYGTTRPMLMDLLFEPEDRISMEYPNVSKVGENLLGDIFCPALYGGTGAYIAAKASPLRDSTGKVVGAIESIRDVTERVRAQEEVRQAGIRFRQVFEDSPVSFWDEDFSEVRMYFDGLRARGIHDFRDYFSRNPAEISRCAALVRIRDVNNATLRLYEAGSKDELLRNLNHVFSEESMPVFMEELISVASGALSFEAEAVTRTMKGKRLDVVLKLIVLPGHEETLSEVLICIIDITERTRVEEALRESKERLGLALDVAQMGTWDLDLVNHTAWRSPRHDQIFGYDSLLPEWTYEMFLDHILPGDRDSVDGAFKEAQAEGHDWEFECRIHRKDGEIRWIWARGRIECGSGGRPGRMLGLVQDITDRKKTADDLIIEKTFTDAILNSIPGLLYLYDEEGNLIRWNKNHELMTGYEAAEMSRMKLFDWFKGDEASRSAIAAGVGKIMDEGFGEAEASLQRKDGSTIPMYFTGRSLVINGHRYFTGIGIDITGSRRAEEALRTSREQLRLLLDSTAEAIYGLDTAGDCTFCNTACLRMLGYSVQGELIGTNMHRKIHHSRADGTPFPVEECRIYQAFRKGEGTHVSDEVLWRADNSSFPAEYWSYPQFHDGVVVGAVVTFIDISERMRMEALLREKSEELDRFFSSSLDLLCIANTRGEFIRLNPEWEKVLGYSLSDLEGRRFLDFVHPDDMERTLAAITTLSRHEDILNFENRYRTKDGAYRWIEWRSRPQGEMIYAAARDITDRKLMEETIRKANRQTALLTSLTRHDINNQIMIILGYLDLAGDRVKDPELEKYFQNVKSATSTIQAQIAFTKVYQDLGSQDPQWQDLDGVLPASHVPDTVSLAASVSGIQVFADPMLPKAFFNLLDNSLRHGKGVTEVRVKAFETRNGLVIAWEDNGIGIAAEEKGKVFTRGYGKNTGLGLFLVREILSLTGISISENGAPGEGARFEIIVPPGMYRHSANGEGDRADAV